MAYTVKQLATVSGVTVRTLHFYDQVGLLRPAYCAANGYRYYEEKELLTLQQILFFRELGFELKQIKRILHRSDFDKLAALTSHRRVLEQNLARTRELIKTIDRTMEHLKGKRKMKDTAMFAGFDQTKQDEYEKQLIQRFGEKARAGIDESKRRVKNWSKADWEKSGSEWNAICIDLVEAMSRGWKENSSEVQAIIRRHFNWLKKFWTPNKESYTGHADFIVTSELRNAYDKHDPKLADFLAAAIKTFAAKELA
jgi:MerR family transcriptional regulator, thiopeptide resistance regulator